MSGSQTRVTQELPHTPPFDATSWFRHVADRAVPGLERVSWAGEPAPGTSGSSAPGAHRRSDMHHHTITRLLRAPNGTVVAHVHLAPDGSAIRADLELASTSDASDLAWTVERLRRWLDLDADPVAVSAALGADPLLAGPVAARPGLRIPGTVDPFEIAVRAVVGQQVSTAAARTVVGRVVMALGEPGPEGLRQFPTADELAAVPVDVLRASTRAAPRRSE